ncbi:MAG: zinc ribbon domain-containing protein [Candidatus Bathyarchaeota archaeon]|nr:zinc ribbon domain-containing protein [Candidatus Bathyarchaeota archaeon]
MKKNHHCPNCGNKFRPEALFCANCGTPLKAKDQAATDVAPVSLGQVQLKLRCPKCGSANKKVWVCPGCQNEEQPYYIDEKANYQCTKCGFDRRRFASNPELVCIRCATYNKASEWKPV